MRKRLAIAVMAALMCVGTVAIRRLAAQDTTALPGQPTQARVWVQNQGIAQAIPVSVEHIASSGDPFPVQLTGTPAVTISGDAPVAARAARQAWEYEFVTIPPSADSAALLNAAGGDGWEAVGIAVTAQRATVVVMKRPR